MADIEGELQTLRSKPILFGDDKWGNIITQHGPYKNEEGIWMMRYLIKPEPNLIAFYPRLQKRENYDYPDKLWIWVEYPMTWVVDENPSRSDGIARVDCTFDWGETPHTKRFEGKDNEIELLWKEKETLKKANMQLFAEYQDLQKSFNEILKLRKEGDLLMKGEKHEPTEQNIPPGLGQELG